MKPTLTLFYIRKIKKNVDVEQAARMKCKLKCG